MRSAEALALLEEARNAAVDGVLPPDFAFSGVTAGINDIQFFDDGNGGIAVAFDIMNSLARSPNAPIENTIIVNLGFDFEAGPDVDVEPAFGIGGALADTINGVNIPGAEFEVNVDNEGNLTVSITAEGTSVEAEVGDSFLFGNQSTVGDENFASLSDAAIATTISEINGVNVVDLGLMVPASFDVGGHISGDEVTEFLDLVGVQLAIAEMDGAFGPVQSVTIAGVDDDGGFGSIDSPFTLTLSSDTEVLG